MTLRYAYVSNGFVQHRLDDALSMLAEEGYSGVGLVLDPHHFDPFGPDLPARVSRLATRLDELGLAVVIETGASFLLDARQKHEPTLVSPEGRELRMTLLRLAVSIAADLGAEAVSLWSGVVHDHADEDELWRRLVEGCQDLVQFADERQVSLAFEPEPGMFIDTIDRYEQLLARLDHHRQFGLTLDVGHVRCNESQPEAESIVRAAPHLRYVQIDDMRSGVHEHLNFGEGEVDFSAALGTLRQIGYEGLVSVELSRHSHTAHTVVPSAVTFLRRMEDRSR